MSPTLPWSVASASARFVATVDLPTPPLPLETAITRSTSGIGCGPRRPGGAPPAGSRLALPPPDRDLAGDAGRLRKRPMDGFRDRLDHLLLGRARCQLHGHAGGGNLDVADEAEGHDVAAESGV